MNAQVKSRLGFNEILIKASDVKRLTGWSDKDLYRYRTMNTIRWKRKQTGTRKDGRAQMGFFYDLNSIDPRLIKKTA